MSTEQHHSATPWQIHEEIGHMVCDASGDAIIDCDHALTNKLRDLDCGNAARIVACVNFCDGLTTQELNETQAAYQQDGFSGAEAIKGSLILMVQKCAVLSASNAKLLSLVKDALLSQCEGDEWTEFAEAAIAEAEAIK